MNATNMSDFANTSDISSSFISDIATAMSDNSSELMDATTDAAPSSSFAPELPYYTCKVYMIVTNGFLQCALYAIAAVGNTLCFFTWHKIGHTKGYNSSVVLMQALAVSDLFTQMPLLFIWVLPNLLEHTGNSDDPFLVHTNPYSSKYGWPLASMGNFDTVWFTTLITVHRYCVLSKPFATFTRKLTSVTSTVVQVIVTAALGIAYQIPRIMGKDIVERTSADNETINVAVSSSLGLRPAFQLWYFTISYITFVNVVPLLISTYFTIRILIVLAKAKSARKTMTADASSGKEAAITAILLTVVIMFIICQLPNTMVRVYLAFRLDAQITCGTTIFYTYSIAVLFISLNSSINIFIYARSQEFRATLKGMCCCGDGGGGGGGVTNGGGKVSKSRASSITTVSTADVSLSTTKINVAVVDSPM